MRWDLYKQGRAIKGLVLPFIFTERTGGRKGREKERHNLNKLSCGCLFHFGVSWVSTWSEFKSQFWTLVLQIPIAAPTAVASPMPWRPHSEDSNPPVVPWVTRASMFYTGVKRGANPCCRWCTWPLVSAIGCFCSLKKYFAPLISFSHSSGWEAETSPKPIQRTVFNGKTARGQSLATKARLYSTALESYSTSGHVRRPWRATAFPSHSFCSVVNFTSVASETTGN